MHARHALHRKVYFLRTGHRIWTLLLDLALLTHKALVAFAGAFRRPDRVHESLAAWNWAIAMAIAAHWQGAVNSTPSKEANALTWQ